MVLLCWGYKIKRYVIAFYISNAHLMYISVVRTRGQMMK